MKKSSPILQGKNQFKKINFRWRARKKVVKKSTLKKMKIVGCYY